jgi:hypothetical protein
VNWIGTLLGNGIMLPLLLGMSITYCGAVHSQSIKPLIMQTQFFTNVTRKMQCHSELRPESQN